ncbi:MAG TPA: hypothetical protein VI122_09470 [Thermoleophilaceae bacterium]|jgi:SSS family solute:Na+ symporter
MKFEVDGVAIAVFCALFLLVTVLGFVAARRKRGDLDLLDERGLGGRRFGTVITWFLLGGDLFTAYTFIAVRLSCGPSEPAASSRCRTRSLSFRSSSS